MSKLIDQMDDYTNAEEIGAALSDTARDYAGHVVYVLLPDGSPVWGYDIREETLSDGSKVYNVHLRAAQ